MEHIRDASTLEGKPSEYACPKGLDPKRYCDVELRTPDLFGHLHCSRCHWHGDDIPQEERYLWGGFRP